MEKVFEVLRGFNCWSVIFRILLATLVGGFIGSERGSHGRAAGLRTHILVCVGAAMTTLTGVYAMVELNSIGDPMRLGAQVISGIGFLGAGTIMVRNHSHITGLTTAAGLWATACLGLAIGAGFYLAVIPAVDASEQPEDLEVSILKNVDEDGESILCAIEDEAELQAVYDLIMDQLYEEEA